MGLNWNVHINDGAKAGSPRGNFIRLRQSYEGRPEIMRHRNGIVSKSALSSERIRPDSRNFSGSFYSGEVSSRYASIERVPNS